VGLCVLVVCVLHARVVLLEAHVQKCIKILANHGILGIAGKLLMRQAKAQKCIKNLANHGILGIAGKLLMRQAKLLHLIKVNL
jgi:hypothetical protein